ncbi:MAG: septation protein IspZ [Cellvibrionales bacterium]|jgi:intracellular septation protein|nr:septation protein IspZ [Cellvibrionales bacterium]MBT5923087.1 septation protein IspZ [Cellvibrionales bacterium]MBT6579821.1 septation protein IspZ [Cellvibrionales bacterium]
MKQILELIPLILFFLTFKMDGETLEILSFSYQFDGIYSATAILMAATGVQVVLTRLLTGKVEKQLLWLFGIIVVAGSATLILRNDIFIMWKPTVFNWGLALVLLGGLLFGKQSLLEKMLGQQLELPAIAWLRLNQLWITNFLIVGSLNLYVAYNFSQAAWVDYKLYSSIGFTLLLMILTMIIVVPHIKDKADESS